MAGAAASVALRLSAAALPSAHTRAALASHGAGQRAIACLVGRCCPCAVQALCDGRGDGTVVVEAGARRSDEDAGGRVVVTRLYVYYSYVDSP